MISSDGGGGIKADGGGAGGLAAATAGGTVDGGFRTEGFVERQGKALCGACACFFIGIPLIIMLICWNESNLVKSNATATLVKDAKEVADCVPTPESDGKLIYATCAVTAPDLAPGLPDVLRPFVPSYHGAQMSWGMEIFQYAETKHENCKKNNDGSKTCHTTYSYSSGWHSSPISSSEFQSPEYSNEDTDFPSNLHGSGSLSAPDHSVIMHSPSPEPKPAFALPTFVADQLPSKGVQPASGMQSGPSQWQGTGDIQASDLHAGGAYITTAQGSPKIGDIRISFSGRMSKEASMAAKQKSRSESPWFTVDYYPPQRFDFWGRKTYQLARLEGGRESKDKFVENWLSQNQGVAWAIRIISLILFVVAFCQILGPISVAADLLRCINCFTCGLGTLLDNAAQTVISLVSCGLGCACWCFFVALSWFFVHPTLSCVLIAIAVLAYLTPTVIMPKIMKKTEAREGYVKMGGVSFNGKLVQPLAHDV